MYKLFEETNKLKTGRRAENKYLTANKCWLSEEKSKASDKKVKKFCHTTAKYREAAHQSRDSNVKKSIFFNTKKFPKIW